jgi:SP family general alpha glucoside:H+ symporter-like MFS transporter
MSEKGFATATAVQRSTIHAVDGQPIKQVVGTDAEIQDKLAERIDHVEDVLEGAATAQKRELEMGFFEALKLYPRASFFSILFSTAIVMEGFDLTL